MKRFTPTALTLLLTALLVASCDDGDDPNGEEDPSEHACEHVDATPLPHDASETRDATAPEVTLSDTPFEITTNWSRNWAGEGCHGSFSPGSESTSEGWC